MWKCRFRNGSYSLSASVSQAHLWQSGRIRQHVIGHHQCQYGRDTEIRQEAHKQCHHDSLGDVPTGVHSLLARCRDGIKPDECIKTGGSTGKDLKRNADSKSLTGHSWVRNPKFRVMGIHVQYSPWDIRRSRRCDPFDVTASVAMYISGSPFKVNGLREISLVT